MRDYTFDPELVLNPISDQSPAGLDLSANTDYLRLHYLASAASSDSDWGFVEKLATDLLINNSKDLQVAVFLLEALGRRYGFPGFRDGLRVVRELIVKFWDKGLYPSIEEDDRARPLAWLDAPFATLLVGTPVTARSDSGSDYSYGKYLESRAVGSEAGCVDGKGNRDPEKIQTREKAMASGLISAEQFDGVVRSTKWERFEPIYTAFCAAKTEFETLLELAQNKLGGDAPSLEQALKDFKGCSLLMEEISSQIRPAEKAQETAAAAASDSDAAAPEPAKRKPPQLPVDVMMSAPSSEPDWRSMTAFLVSSPSEEAFRHAGRLAATEPAGRGRFTKRLAIAEKCIELDKRNLATLILEELNGEVEKYHLEAWEGSELVGRVWSRLYRLYKQSGDNRAADLYARLSRLEPWYALACADE